MVSTPGTAVRWLGAAVGVWLVALATVIGPAAQSADPIRYSDKGELLKPADFREWVFLSAGLGMNYNPQGAGAANPSRPPAFTNVYVNPSSYRAFMKTGAWPDRTMFVLEIRGSASEGSINRAGHFQTGLRAIEANVKDARLKGGWGFYNFADKQAAVAPLPQSASCYSCHAENTAVEHTFVQFYPALMEVARQKGTVKATWKEGAPIR